jgi:hypothetical protein
MSSEAIYNDSPQFTVEVEVDGETVMVSLETFAQMIEDGKI